MSIENSFGRVLVVCAVLFSCSVIHAKECGYRPTYLGFANGRNAYENEFPWQVSLNFQNEKSDVYSLQEMTFLCGGVILEDNWVITAAHCLELPDVDYIIVAGSYNRSQPSSNEKAIGVKNIYIHPNYNNESLQNDIALLELNDPIGLDSGELNAICLSGPEDIIEGKDAVVSGWGSLSQNSTNTDILKRATVTIQKLESCRSFYSQIPGVQVTESNICAGEDSGECFGDDGGPLQIEKDGRWYLLGITSSNIICGPEEFPSLYTRVPSYMEFIANVTGITPLNDEPENEIIIINIIINIFIDSLNFIRNNTYNFGQENGLF